MEHVFQFQCPWCGETNDSFYDMSEGNTTYIEDCQICCRPINLSFTISSDGKVQATATRS